MAATAICFHLSTNRSLSWLILKQRLLRVRRGVITAAPSIVASRMTASNFLPVSNARIASAIVIGNTVVGLGRNSYKTHPLQAKYGKTEHTIHLHAEIDAIKNSLRRVSVDDLSKATIYISRVKKRDRKRGFIPGLSAPCSGCMGAITDFGIKRIVYSLDGGGFQVIE